MLGADVETGGVFDPLGLAKVRKGDTHVCVNRLELGVAKANRSDALLVWAPILTCFFNNNQTTGRVHPLPQPPDRAQARPRGHACLPRHPRAEYVGWFWVGSSDDSKKNRNIILTTKPLPIYHTPNQTKPNPNHVQNQPTGFYHLPDEVFSNPRPLAALSQILAERPVAFWQIFLTLVRLCFVVWVGAGIGQKRLNPNN